MSIAVITFPGSNCDRDCVRIAALATSGIVHSTWHKDHELPLDTQGVILPGGFSYGDSLRAGAMAAHSPILSAIKRFVDRGGPVLGICNGFQILCEAKLLPGALLPNAGGLFQCELVELEVAAAGEGLMAGYVKGQKIRLPIAHAEGNYFADEETLDALEREDRIALRYTHRHADGRSAVNGASRSIAGIVGGPSRNVLGLMPHPERRAELRLGGEDGLPMMRALAAFSPSALGL